MTDTSYLEEALIGGLLNQPHRTGEVSGLTGQDFTDPLCQALWTTLTTRPSWPAEPVNVVPMAQRVAAVSDLHPSARSPGAIAEMQVHAPTRPHLRTYAQLIAEATTRRHVLALGYQLTDLHTRRSDDALHSIDAITDQLRHMKEAQTRTLDRFVPAGDPDPVVAADPTHGEKPRASMAEDRDQAFTEYAVLGAAIHDSPPASRAEALATICAHDLTHPKYRHAWQAVRDLDAAHVPIDEITVHWQLTRTTPEPTQRPTLKELRDSRWAATGYRQAMTHLLQASTTRASQRLHGILTSLEQDQPRLERVVDTIEHAGRQLREHTHRSLRPALPRV
jgi:replicative DNA helicase